MKTSLSLSAAALSLFGTVACGQVEAEQQEPLQVDPDPPVQCTAYPACHEDETEVVEGTPGAREASACGNVIYCAAPIGHCLAMPGCPEGETEVPAGTAGGHDVSLCDLTITCAAEPPVECQAVPACATNESVVPDGVAGSHEVTVCGKTISCMPLNPDPQPDPCPGCGLG